MLLLATIAVIAVLEAAQSPASEPMPSSQERGSPAVAPAPPLAPAEQPSGGSSEKPLGPCLVLGSGESIGVVGSRGMTSTEFSRAIAGTGKQPVHAVLLELDAKLGRHDSLVEFLRSIKDARERGVRLVAFVRTHSAENWCIALSCDRWVGTAATTQAISRCLGKEQSVEQFLGLGTGSALTTSPSPSGCSRQDVLARILAEGTPMRRASGPVAQPSSTPSVETLELLKSLLPKSKDGIPAPVLDRKAALEWAGGEQVREYGPEILETQEELEKIDELLLKLETDSSKQKSAISSAKQKDGPRADALKQRLDATREKARKLVEKADDLLRQP